MFSSPPCSGGGLQGRNDSLGVALADAPPVIPADPTPSKRRRGGGGVRGEGE